MFSKNAQASVLALASAFALGTVGAPALAGDEGFNRPIATGVGSRTSTRGYLGLSVSFGGGGAAKSGLVVGVQSIRVRSSNRLHGVDANVRFSFDSGFDRFAVAGLVGRRDVYANIGGGYSARRGEAFATGGVQAPFMRAGADFGLQSGNFEPYLEVNTLDRPRRVSGGGLACPDGYSLEPASDWSIANPDLFLDGFICVDFDFWD